MKPYLAVLYDSFIESISSRVLWILLAGWILILGALFPLSISEGESYQVRTADITSPKVVMDQLAAASNGKGTRAQRAVYNKLDKDFQAVLQERQKNGRRIFVGRLVSALNQVIESPDLFEQQSWPTAERRQDLKELIAKENKSPQELQRFNRRLLDLAFPNSIKSSAGQATWVTYAGMKFTEPLPFTARQIRPFVESALIPTVLWIGLGMVAMMVAIVITSPMIPDMFQTGSLHLLLSKPLSRSLLYLSKYLGGCIFVAINIAFLVVGLYFYCGIQLEIWNKGILWCIPLFIFAFMIFYSVSALVGLIWKNPIICVVVTALFWGICFTIGIVYNLSEGFLKGPPTLQQVLVVGDTPIVANQQGRIQFWNEETSQWQSAFGDVNGQRVLGPIYLPKTGALYFGRPPFLPFGMSTGESIRLEMARLPELSKETLSESDSDEVPANKKWWDDTRLDSGPDLPVDTLEIAPWKDTFLAVSENGIFRFDQEAASKADQSKVSLFGFDMKIPQASEPYKKISDPLADYRKPLAFAASRTEPRCVLYTRGKLLLFHEEGDALVQDGEVIFDFPPETVATVAMQDSSAIVCPTGFAPVVVDLKTMAVAQTVDSLGKITAKRVSADRQGRVAILTTEGDIWLLQKKGDASQWEAAKPSLTGQGDAATIAFDEESRLWVTHNVKSLDAWSADMSSVEKQYRPRSTTPEWLLSYVIQPLYLVNPKPSAINETIQYVLRNPDNKMPAIDRADLDIPQVERDPWQPIWSNGIFIVVMLTLGCWYLYRQDL